MKVEMRATVTVVMEFPTEKEAEAWATMADTMDLLQQEYVEERVECFFLEEEDDNECTQP